MRYNIEEIPEKDLSSKTPYSMYLYRCSFNSLETIYLDKSMTLTTITIYLTAPQNESTPWSPRHILLRGKCPKSRQLILEAPLRTSV